MEASPQKRILTEAAFEQRKLPRTAATQFLSDELIAQLANVGRRVRYNVSQGYASNRNTPQSTPYGSPVKPIPTNPSNTPQTSPVRFSIFRTEHEIIHEAAGELENVHLDSTNTKPPMTTTNEEKVDLVEKMMAVGESSPRKRRRATHDEDYYSGTEYSSPNDDEDNYSEDEEDEDDDDYNPRNKSKSKSKQPKRSVKALPKTKAMASGRARRPAPFADADKSGPSKKNPFLV